jgi:hypothetical protein
MLLHDLMIAMKLGRHYKGKFRLTKAGQALVGHPGRIFNTAVPFFLFRVDHAASSRFDDDPILGNWDIFLNVLNVETEDGATGADLRRILYGEPKGPLPRFDDVMSQPLRPGAASALLGWPICSRNAGTAPAATGSKTRCSSRRRSGDRRWFSTPMHRSRRRYVTEATAGSHTLRTLTRRTPLMPLIPIVFRGLRG